MLNRLHLASLFSVAAGGACTSSPTTAPNYTSRQPAPAPTPTPTPTPIACAPKGRAVLEIDTVPNKRLGAQPVKTIRFELTDTGAWTYVETHDDRVARSYTGCLGAAELASLRSKMAGVPWTTSLSKVACAAVPPTFTTYSVDGSNLYTHAMCAGDDLDAASEKVVAEINLLVSKLVAPHEERK